MMTRARLATLTAIALFVIGTTGATTGAAADPQLPLAFEINEGQWSDEIRFLARGHAGMIALEERGAVLISAKPEQTIRMDFSGSSGKPRIDGLDPLPHKSHYFIGGDPAEWRRDVRSYRRVVYRQIYDGIDAVFHSSPDGELEYDFVVHAGSDPRAIRLRFDGANGIAIDDGELVIRTAGDPIRMRRPVAFQDAGENRSSVAVRYQKLGRNRVGFVVGPYDRSKELIIDPVVLGYSTFLGGASNDAGSSVAVDDDRNIYIAGTTISADFPIRGGVRDTIAGGQDLFVVKLNPAGNEILFSTFLGGSGDETAPRLVLDSRGDIYLAGATRSPDFPTTENALQRTYGGGPSDGYVAKLSADGSRLLFSTFLGGEEGDPVWGLTIDAMRDVYISGSTLSTRYPVTPGAVQQVLRGTRNAYVAKLRIDPPSLIYATYLGGSNDTTLGGSLAVDAAGAAYVIGSTLATDFPTTPNALQTSFAGAGIGGERFGDAFVSKISPDGSTLLYSTYLGGLSGEIPTSIVVDSNGAAYVTGLTCSKNFPVTAGSYQTLHGGGDCDAFISKLGAAGDRLLFSTYLGGNNSEQTNVIALDRFGNIHVTGGSSAADFPTTADAYSRTRKGENDGIVSILSADGSQLLYSTYLGGSAPSGAPQDNLFGMALDGAGNIYVVGQTRSTDFPITPDALQTAYRGQDEAFLTKFTALRERPEGELRVVPVVGSTPGALGSFFKTAFQLHNPRSTTIGGRLVFHPQGRSGNDSDPFFDFVLAPGETIAISDLLPAMSQSGLGSVDLLTAEGQRPESVIRIFNDAGDAGTTGMSQEPVAEHEALQQGSTGVLIAPASMGRSRFNIGIRTLRDGATLMLTVRQKDGALKHTTTRSYSSELFEQRNAADFLGIALEADDSIALHIDSGSAVIYGSTTDNITQDPSLQIARASDSVEGEMRIIPVVGSTAGALGSFFKTAVQLHNPGETPISGRLVYHAQGVIGSNEDPALAYSLQPGETVSWDDLLPEIGLSGLGSADIISTEGPLPLSVVRIFNDAGERGTTGMTEDQVALSDVLAAGDEGVLIAPPDPTAARFNIGIRTLETGATITATVRNRFGNVVKEVTRTYPPVFFTQLTAAAFVEMDLQGSDTIRLHIDSGSAIVYGAITDNISQDPILAVGRRLD
jgi:hypothetical protein